MVDPHSGWSTLIGLHFGWYVSEGVGPLWSILRVVGPYFGWSQRGWYTLVDSLSGWTVFWLVPKGLVDSGRFSKWLNRISVCPEGVGRQVIEPYPDLSRRGWLYTLVDSPSGWSPKRFVQFGRFSKWLDRILVGSEGIGTLWSILRAVCPRRGWSTLVDSHSDWTVSWLVLTPEGVGILWSILWLIENWWLNFYLYMI